MDLNLKFPTSIWHVFILFSVLVGCGSLITSVAGQLSGIRSSQPLVITNCHVVSVKGGRITPKQMILIKDGLIALTGPMQESRVPKSAQVIDGTGKYVMPGLFDMHVHLGHESDLLSYLAG